MSKVVDGREVGPKNANEDVRLVARSIAHDFNNLLSAILGHASYLRLLTEPGSEIDQTAATIEAAAERARSLSARLYELGKRPDVDGATMAPVDVHQLIREVAATLGHGPDGVVELALELSAGNPGIRGDASQLNRLLMNLAVNAREAVGARGGEIAIRTRDGERGLTLEVADSGPGIAPSDRARVFQPTYSTKDNGSGLGLAIVDRIAKLHGATVEVDGNEPQGAVFRVVFPKA